jgi:hypothetical protein
MAPKKKTGRMAVGEGADDHHPHLTSQISKFGVGAIESAFYLGTELKV